MFQTQRLDNFIPDHEYCFIKLPLYEKLLREIQRKSTSSDLLYEVDIRFVSELYKIGKHLKHVSC